jgi:hypothetical protein
VELHDLRPANYNRVILYRTLTGHVVDRDRAQESSLVVETERAAREPAALREDPYRQHLIHRCQSTGSPNLKVKAETRTGVAEQVPPGPLAAGADAIVSWEQQCDEAVETVWGNRGLMRRSIVT